VASPLLVKPISNVKRSIFVRLVNFSLFFLGNVCGSELFVLPDNFDPDVYMVVEERDGRRVHHVWDTAELAEQVVARGNQDDLVIAEKMIDAVLRCQESHQENPHYGNYFRTLEKPVVEDLNAVAFVQRAFLPMVIQHGDRLSEATRQRLFESFRLGCGEIRRLDVAPTYTNVTSMHVLSACLGGELLGDKELAQYGYEKMARLAKITAENGTVYEYNSPTYVEVTVDALQRLASLVRDEETRVRAKTMLTQLMISTALRIDRRSGYLTGPHSRATFNQTVCGGPPEIALVREWVEKAESPDWLRVVLEHPLPTGEMTETAYAPWNIGMTTYFSDSFVFGTATREISRQTNVFLAHFSVPKEPRPGVLFTRYLINDTWFGDPDHPGERKSTPTLSEAGKYLGVQVGCRAIGVYAPRTLEHPDSLAPASLAQFRSAKLVMVWKPKRYVREVWLNEDRVTSFPVEVPRNAVIVVGMGDAWTAIRPFRVSDLGHDAPLRLIDTEDEIALEMYNYLGAEKVFWDLERNSRFFRGAPPCAFYAELAERRDFEDAPSFARAVASGCFRDELAPAVTTYRDAVVGKRPWTLECSRDGKTLGLEVDLVKWNLEKRWDENGEIPWRMWESPVARQNASGRVQVADAVLTCGAYPAWLYANPEKRLWVAGYHGEPAPLELRTSSGIVRVPRMGTGTITWHEDNVQVDAIALEQPIEIDAVGVRIVTNP